MYIIWPSKLENLILLQGYDQTVYARLCYLLSGKYCKFGNFARILFSRIALKDIFATLKN